MSMDVTKKAQWYPDEQSAVLLDRTVGDYFDEQVAQYSDMLAVSYKQYPEFHIPEINWTYKEYQSKVNQLAKGLIAEGFQYGDHIAVWAPNIPEWPLLQLASAKVGLVLVTVNPALRADEVEYVLKTSDTKALFFLSNFRNRNFLTDVQSVMNRIPLLQKIITFDKMETDTSNENINHSPFQDIYLKGDTISDLDLKEKQLVVRPTDTFQIQFTSGTTGFPKGAMITHRGVLNNARLSALRWKLGKGDSYCSPLPFFHTGGSVISILCAIAAGASLLPVPYFTATDCVDIMDDIRQPISSVSRPCFMR